MLALQYYVAFHDNKTFGCPSIFGMDCCQGTKLIPPLDSEFSFQLVMRMTVLPLASKRMPH